jgi:hypothetical protein
MNRKTLVAGLLVFGLALVGGTQIASAAGPEDSNSNAYAMESTFENDPSVIVPALEAAAAPIYSQQFENDDNVVTPALSADSTSDWDAYLTSLGEDGQRLLISELYDSYIYD